MEKEIGDISVDDKNTDINESNGDRDWIDRDDVYLVDLQ